MPRIGRRRRAPAIRAAAARSKPISLFSSLMHFVPAYFLAIGGSLAVSVAAARTLGTADFGYFVATVTATVLVGQLSLLGVHRSGLREAATSESDEALAELRSGVRAVLLIPLPIAATATAGAVYVWRGDDANGIATAILSGALVVAAGYQKVSANFLRGLGHVRAATLITGRSGGALVVSVQAVCVLMVAWLAPEWGLAGVLAGTAAGYALPLAWAWWVLHRSWPRASRTSRTLHDLRLVVRRDWRFAISQTGGFLNSTLELWLAGFILSAGATSVFAAAQRVGHLLLIPTTSLQIVFSPALARLSKKGAYPQLESLVRTAATVSTTTTAVVWLPMVLVPGLVLTIVFGDSFAVGAPVLILLASGYLANAFSGMSATTLSMAHHEGDVAVINWCAVVLRLVAGFACATLWGVTGLAASSAAIATLHYAATWATVRWRMSISTHATMRPKLSLLTRTSG